MNPEPGGLTMVIDDRSTQVTMTGGGTWTLPIGPLSLVDGELERTDRPTPSQLTNALGITADHFDDILHDAPIVASTPSLLAVGPHAIELARVEFGATELPSGYVLQRADAEEVFRTLVAEPIAERLDNPGLDPAHVESIIGTCCVILAIIRRLDLQHVGIVAEADSRADGVD